MLTENKKISIPLFTSILNAVKQPFTQYSVVCQLKEKIIYLYHARNFKKATKINLKEELKKGHANYDIPSFLSR